MLNLRSKHASLKSGSHGDYKTMNKSTLKSKINCQSDYLNNYLNYFLNYFLKSQLLFNLIYVPTTQIEEKLFEKMTIWKSVIPVANTQKLHCLRAHNSKQLHVSSVSDDNDVSFVGIFKDVACDEEESVQEPVQNGPVFTRNLKMNLGDWVLVSYDRQKCPGEVTSISGLDFEVNAMHESCGQTCQGAETFKWETFSFENFLKWGPPWLGGEENFDF